MRRTQATLAALTIGAAITVFGAPPVLAGGGGGGGAVCDGFSRGDTIRTYDSCFAGTAHFVDPGADSVTVTNDGEMPHTITGIDGSFDVYLDVGDSATLELPGDAVIPVYCTLHGTTSGRGMAGVIIRDADAGVTRAAADDTVAAADVLPIGTTSAESGNDGLSVVAVVLAGLAAALSLVAIAAARAARRTTLAP